MTLKKKDMKQKKKKDNKFVRNSIPSFARYQQTCGSGFYYVCV